MISIAVSHGRSSLQEEATQEHEVAEALFDLANMFAAAEPVLEAEEAATTSPRAGRANTGGGHRAKRARGAKARAAEPPAPQYNSRASSGRNAQHNNAAAASGFQVHSCCGPWCAAVVSHVVTFDTVLPLAIVSTAPMLAAASPMGTASSYSMEVCCSEA